MTWELFERRRQAGGRKREGAPDAPVEFCIYKGCPGIVVMTRAAAQLAKFTPGGRLLVLVDRERRLVAFQVTDSPDGWKISQSTGGSVTFSVGRLLARFGVQPGRYEEVSGPDGPLPGFRYGAAGAGVQGVR